MFKNDVMYRYIGLFTPSHMNFEVDRQNQNPIQEPSLVEMVEKAINILGKRTGRIHTVC